MEVPAATNSVVQASRILYRLGILDAFGHVSCRSPDRPDRFLMSRSMAPGLVTAADVVEFDLDGELVGAPGTRVFLERFIHAEIYRARSDVGGIAHSHAPGVVPFTVVPGDVLQPVSHMCGFLHGIPAAYDVADCAGDGTDLLIRDARLGASFAAHLGGASVALMRAHGFTAVGTDIRQATFRAVYTARNCEIQQAALGLGSPRHLSEAEARACDATANGQIDRAWDLWVREHAS